MAQTCREWCWLCAIASVAILMDSERSAGAKLCAIAALPARCKTGLLIMLRAHQLGQVCGMLTCANIKASCSRRWTHATFSIVACICVT